MSRGVRRGPLYRFLHSLVWEDPYCSSASLPLGDLLAHSLPDNQEHLKIGGLLSTEVPFHPTRLEDFCFLVISFIYSCSQLGILPNTQSTFSIYNALPYNVVIPLL